MPEYTDIKTAKGMDVEVVMPDISFQVPGKKYPTILFFHGIKERYDEGGRFPTAVRKYGPIGQVFSTTNPVKLPFLLIGPQLRSGDWTKEQTNDILDSVIAQQFPVDLNQIYIMGASLGGRGLLSVISDPATCSRFAAFVAMCPGWRFGTFNPKNIAADGIPGWIAHAPNDTVVEQQVGLDYYFDINAAAGCSRVRFTEVGLSGHSIWGNFLKPFHHVYEWLMGCTLQNKSGNTSNYDNLLNEFNKMNVAYTKLKTDMSQVLASAM